MANQTSSPVNNQLSPRGSENQTESSDSLTDAQEVLFLKMKSRQLERDRAGVKKNTAPSFHIFVLVIGILALTVLAGGENGQDGWSVVNGIIYIDLVIHPQSWIMLITLPTIVILTFDIFAGKKWFTAYLLILIYYPLFFGFLSHFLFSWVKLPFFFSFWAIFALLTFFGTLFVHYFYPKWIKSNNFRDIIGAKRFWGIYHVERESWTIAYRGSMLTSDHLCQYQGSISEETGLPDGFGEWIDDSPTGECLIGKWKDGVPMAPFTSSIHRSGDAFNAVALIYYHCSDDTFTKNKSKYTNELPARMGIASVECSVQGAFYKHVPHVQLFLDEPFTVKDEYMESFSSPSSDHISTVEALKKCYPYLETREINASQSMQDDNLKNSIIINSDNPRGIQVEGHVDAATGNQCSDIVDEVVVQVIRKESESRINQDCRRRSISSMRRAPERARSSYFGKSQDNDVSQTNDSVRDKEEIDAEANTGDVVNDSLHILGVADKESPFRLKVQNWIPVQQKEALVLLPGLANSIAKTLRCFGQFIATTTLSDRVYPVVFGWPTASVPTYRFACSGANDKRTLEHFLQLIEGLAASGIKRVHFLSHSMGAQTLIAAFANVDKNTGYSPVSNCFHMSPSFEEDGKHREEKENRMICKSMILLNPDFPRNEFVNHSVAHLRRVCNHITVVGDKNDQALYYSSVINGLCNRWGHKNPVDNINERSEQTENQRRFNLELRAGKEIYSLYLPASNSDSSGDDPKPISKKLSSTDNRILAKSSHGSGKRWLDIDVIDSTNLDVNFDNIRHSAYNTNPILLRDLEDIIVSGRRARNRSALIHREGNIYSYSHVPAFVTL